MFLRNNSSVIRTQREFRRRFPHPTGSTLDRPKSGRPRKGRSAENIDAVREDVEECPETSTRRRATQLGISRRTLQRILVKDLKMFPYKTQMTHQLLPADHRARLDYCQRVINLNLEEDDFPSKLVMKTPLHPLKVTVWCGICVDRVIGPYFFEDAGGNAITVTGERYRTMLREFLIPSLDELGLEHFRLLSLGFFEISGVCEQATDSRSSKRKHSSRNNEHIAGSVTASYAKCHK
ncbi:hypothetical protein ABMA28_001081 [Loxostege sticticalis]|uniref:DUF4817 domain-containing protein n=1 Tax=Loxostege sticticalis TaxID=481309 RepID=A0ABD0T681_LOXSC